MPSAALAAFQQGVQEINDLERADPTPIGGAPVDPAIARVVGRATVVLLSSHFERYIYAVNEEATRHLVTSITDGTQLPEAMRLLHARPALDSLLRQVGIDEARNSRSFCLRMVGSGCRSLRLGLTMSGF